MKKISLILFAVLAFSFINSDVDAKRPRKITVMSYNVRAGTANDGENSWQYRYPASAVMIKELAPDVYGVQEALDFQINYLTANPGNYKSVGVGRDNGEVMGEGTGDTRARGEHMSIFYNTKTIKLLKWGSFWLSETPEKPSMGWDAACMRTATWALLKDKKTGRKFYFVNTHLDHIGWEARRKGLALIVDRIDSINPEGYPMILTGDFNMTVDRHEFDELNTRMVSAREIAPVTDHSTTYHGWGAVDNEMIDFIYEKGFSACTEFETIKKEFVPGIKYVSDHYPIRAVLVF